MGNELRVPAFLRPFDNGLPPVIFIVSNFI